METLKEVLNHIIHLPVWILIAISVVGMVIFYLKGYHDGTQEKKYMND